ncbi:MAG: hypothetical protein O6952_10645 [Planctomycetota bacterium]|nr:hypothetical protein [Planctomycetota bacterium]
MDRSRPSFPDGLEWEECETIIDFVRRFRGHSPDFGVVPPMPPWRKAYMRFRGQSPYFGPMPFWRKEYIRLVGLDFEEYHRVRRGIREASALPVPEMRKMSVQLDVAAESWGEIAPPRVRPWIEMHLKMQTVLACLRTAVMVHLYRAEHEGAWPEDLASVGQIPLDPWDGKPLRYKPPEENRPPFVYSVGANLLDDGGRAEEPMRFRADRGHHDFVFPLGPWPEEDEGGPERSRR